MTNESDALATVFRLLDATNGHDVESIVACFSPGYRNETPAHPLRSFTGDDQVRRNWAAILAGIPDHRSEITATAVDGGTVWTEWRMSGTHLDGSPHEMAGVVIFTLDDDRRIAAARFYLEMVERSTGDADALLAREFAGTEAER
jgi:limonene-1,2-epoxide hydrolase